MAHDRLRAAGWSIPDRAGVGPVVALAEAALAGKLNGTDPARVQLRYVRPPDAKKPTHLFKPPTVASVGMTDVGPQD